MDGVSLVRMLIGVAVPDDGASDSGASLFIVVLGALVMMMGLLATRGSAVGKKGKKKNGPKVNPCPYGIGKAGSQRDAPGIVGTGGER